MKKPIEDHTCKYSDLMITQGNDEEFISCMVCQKEYTYEEAKELEKHDRQNNN